jgi:ABC-type uncharacterized transport system permease subunit
VVGDLVFDEEVEGQKAGFCSGFCSGDGSNQHTLKTYKYGTFEHLCSSLVVYTSILIVLSDILRYFALLIVQISAWFIQNTRFGGMLYFMAFWRGRGCRLLIFALNP